MQTLFEQSSLQLLNELQDLRQTQKDFASLQKFLRDKRVDTNLVATLLSQLTLRDEAHKKFGADSQKMLFTRSGLEQASRKEITNRHATRFHQAGIKTVADLGCGIGSQSIAFARQEISTSAIEIDPLTANIAEHNLKTLAKTNFTIYNTDATKFRLSHEETVFFDPARRKLNTQASARIYDPDNFSPPISFVFETLQKHSGAVKLGPAFAHKLIPENAEAEWISYNGELLENVLWFGALHDPTIKRRATVLKTTNGLTTAHEMHAASFSEDAAVRELGEYLYEPDSAIIRARLIGDLANQLGANMLDQKIAYFSADQLHRSPFASAFKIAEVLPLKTKVIAGALAKRDIGTLEIKKRGVDLDPQVFRKQLKLKGNKSATLILTRVADKRFAYIAERV